jgi:hypothetical protein
MAMEVQRMLDAMTQSQKIALALILLSHPAVKAAIAGTESNKINELPDRGSDNETKTVTDPHGKPVQE